MIDFKGHRFETDLILTCVRWYLAYPLRGCELFPICVDPDDMTLGRTEIIRRA